MRTKKEYHIYVIDYGAEHCKQKFNNRRAAIEYLNALKAQYTIKNDKPWKFGNASYWRIDDSLFKSLVFAEHTIMDYQYCITTK